MWLTPSYKFHWLSFIAHYIYYHKKGSLFPNVKIPNGILESNYIDNCFHYVNYWNCYVFYNSHQHPQIIPIWVYASGNQYNVCINIINTSSKPVCITNVRIVKEHKEYSITDYHVPLSIPVGHNDQKAYSDELPISLVPFSGVKVVWAFQHVDSELLANGFTIKVNYKKNHDIKCNFHTEMFIDSKEYTARLDYRNYTK